MTLEEKGGVRIAGDAVMFHSSPNNTPLVECAESVQGAKELVRHSGVRRCSEALMETRYRSGDVEHTPLSVIKASYRKLSQLPDPQIVESPIGWFPQGTGYGGAADKIINSFPTNISQH